MSRWFRFYDDAMHDPKLLKLSDSAFRAWMTLLCVASKNDGTLPPADEIALTLRCKQSLVAGWIAELVAGGLLDKTESGFVPHNWSERQYKSDSSAERMKRHRSKQRDVTPTVTSDVTVTVQNRTEADTEQNRADARTDLQKRAGDFRQAIVSAYASANSTVLPETSRAELWISQGYDPEICLAVIAGMLAKKPSIGSLNYFDNPIAEAHTKKAPPRQSIGPPKDDGLIEVLDQWALDAWSAYERANGLKQSPRNKRGGWRFPTKWPPGYEPPAEGFNPPPRPILKAM